MNRLVEQASRRSGGAGLRPALTGRMPVLPPTCGSWSQCAPKSASVLSMNRSAAACEAPAAARWKIPTRYLGTAAPLPSSR